MGQRANLVVKDGGAWKLYYSHWAANALDHHLFWGPDHARAFIEAQKQVGTRDWLDTTWCEGAALLDCDARRLLFFGGEDIEYEVPWRRTFLTLMRAAWHPWTVEWAAGELPEIVAALGVSPETVVAPVRSHHPEPYIWPAGNLRPTEAYGVISVSERDAIGLYPAANLPAILRLGPRLLSMLPAREDAITLAEFPHGGIHVDPAAATVHAWWATTLHRGQLAPIVDAWPDWRLVLDADRYETQLTLAGDGLRFPQVDEPKLVADIVQFLRRQMNQGYTPQRLQEMAGLLSEGRTRAVTTNPQMLEHVDVPLGPEERERIIRQALARAGFHPQP